MIIVPKAQLRFLLAGRTLTLLVPPRQRPYKKTRNYAIGLTHREAICRVEILDITTTADGAELKIRQITIDKPHLLAARSEYGYTTNPHQALRDEPEAITGVDLDQFASANAVRFQRERSEELERQRVRSLNLRLREAQRRRDPDAIAEIRRDLEDLEQQIRDAA